MAIVRGTNGGDTLNGTSQKDIIIAKKGDDAINSGDGNDFVNAGKGDDTVDSGAGHDIVFAGKGDDSVDAGSGHDYVNAGKGDDSVDAGDGCDIVLAGRGDDTVEGGAGNDLLFGNQGTDTAVYQGSIFDYDISTYNIRSWFGNVSVARVEDQNTANGDEGTDRLVSFERLEFDDYTLNIDGTNNGPLVIAEDQTTDEDTATSFGVSIFDFDGDSLSVDSITVSGGGTVSVTGSSPLTPSFGTGEQLNISFDPNGAYEGLNAGETVVETVTLVVSDGNGGTTTRSFEITIEGVDDGPVANDDSATVAEDGSVVIDVLSNDSGAGQLTIAEASAANGTVNILPDGTIEYIPNLDFNGEDQITYVIEDEDGQMSTAKVTVMVTAVNDDPTAVDDTATVAEDGSVDINVLDNDVDIDGDALMLLPGATAANGTVVVNRDGSLTYSPDPDFNGTDTITYTVQDPSGATSTATVTVTVTPENDAPVIDDPDAPTVTVDEADGVASIDLLARVNDVDGDEVSVVSASFINPETGERLPISVDFEGGVAVFDPNAFGLDEGQSQTATLQFIVDDNSGAENAVVTGTVEVLVQGSGEVTPPPDDNNAPEADDFNLFDRGVITEAGEDGVPVPIVIDMSSRIRDADGDMLTITSVNGNSFGFSFDGTNLTIDPTIFGLTGEDPAQLVNLNYTVDDGSGLENGTATGTVQFLFQGSGDDSTPAPDPDNTAPTANDVEDTVNEADGPYSVDLNGLVSDADGDRLVITGAAVIAGTVIPLSVEGGVLTFDPAALGLDSGQSEVLTIQYTVEDDSGEANSSSTGTLTLTVNGQDDEVGPPAPTTATLDFEPFASEDDLSINISGTPYEGFRFTGNANVIETDEIGGGRGGGENGITRGQTTEGGQNVLVGSAETDLIEVPNPDDPRNPTFEEVVIESFGLIDADATIGIGDGGAFLTSGLAGQEIPLPEVLPEGFGDAFNFDGISLNATQDGPLEVTVTLYTLGVIEVANEINPSFSTYMVDYVVADSFVFTVDGSTGATELDFNSMFDFDGDGVADDAAFDNLYAIGFSTEDNAPIVIDDLILSF